MTRRTKSTSTANAVRVMSAKDVVPPANVPLDENDLRFFESIVAEFARADWTAHSLEVAALLARTMADLEREQRLMREEGSIVHTEKGTPVINPRKTAVQMNASTISSYRRSLQLHARAQGGEARETGKRKSTNVGLQDDLDDNLLARPN